MLDADSVATEAGEPDLDEDFFYSDTVSNDVGAAAVLSDTIDELDHLRETISVYGVTPSLMHFTNRDRLLSSAMPAFASLESLTADIAADAPSAIAAQEAIGAKIKQLAAAWFAKAWAAAKAMFDKVEKFANVMDERVKKAAGYIKDKTFDAAKTTKTFIKAHPIASAFIALAAIAAIGLVVTAIWGVPLPATAAELATWGAKINSLINAGLSKFGITIHDGQLAQNILFDKKLAHLKDLGYCEAEALKLLDAAARVAAGDTSVSGAVRKAAEHAARLLKDVTWDTPGYASKRAAINTLLKLTGTLTGQFLLKYANVIVIVISIALRIWVVVRQAKRA